MLGLGLGIPGVIGALHFAGTGEVWTFLGFPTYGGGPFERVGLHISVPLLLAIVAVCVAEVAVGVMLLLGVPRAATVSYLLLPVEFAFWIGFALPFGPPLALPGPRAVQGVVPAAVGLAGVRRAPTTRAAGDDTTDRAQLHPRIVDGLAGAVYSLVVLGLHAHVRVPAQAMQPAAGSCGQSHRKLHVNPCEAWGRKARLADTIWEAPMLAQVAGITVDDDTLASVVAVLGSTRRPVEMDRARIYRRIRELALEHAAGGLGDGTYLTRLKVLREQRDAIVERTAPGLPGKRAVEWLRVLGESLQAAGVPKEKADLRHAIYDRITVAGPEIVGVRLTQAAYAHG